MLNYFLMMLLQRSPLLLVALGGIVFAIIRWRRHPSVSLLVVIGLLFYMIKIAVFAALYYWLPTLRVSMKLSYAAIGNLYDVSSVLSDIGFSIVLVILVVAAFFRRSRVAPAI